MTPEQQKVVDELRSEGYVIVVWQPDEIGNASASALEDYVISTASAYLEEFNGLRRY